MIKLTIEDRKIKNIQGLDNLKEDEFIKIISTVINMIIIDEHIKISPKKMKYTEEKQRQLILDKRKDILELLNDKL